MAAEYVIAETQYGLAVPAVARKGSVIGTQFHPEKSGDVGRRLLENLRAELAAPPG
jgi:glutamine amidotransferase